MDELQRLAVRARGGDLGARERLRKQLAGPMKHIVRRALRHADGPRLAQRILREANRIRPASQAGPLENNRVGDIARRLCAAVAGEFAASSESALRDTIRI